MMKATEKITGQTVRILRKANTERPAVVIKYEDGSTQIQFSSLWFYYRSSREKVAVSAMIAGASFIIAVITLSVGMFSETADTEVWNGKVTSKEKEQVSCSHSYSCNCRSVQSCSGSGKDRSCTSSTQCDTCYEHNHDFDWVVHTTIGGKEIDRIDRQ